MSTDFGEFTPDPDMRGDIGKTKFFDHCRRNKLHRICVRSRCYLTRESGEALAFRGGGVMRSEIERLKKIKARYRVDSGKNASLCKFETLAASRKEDLLRAKRILKALKKYCPGQIDQDRALKLAAQLLASGEGRAPPDSLASSVHMRICRAVEAGHLWQLVDEVGAENVHAFAAVPKTWEFSADRLGYVYPGQLLRSLRTALYAQGAASASGWLYAYLHGEWDPIGKVYRLHVHGFAYGEMVDVLDRLRKVPNFATSQYLPDGTPNPVYRRMRLSRKGLYNLPLPLTYPLQAFWPSRRVNTLVGDHRSRDRVKRRLPEPNHTQVQLWLDQWQFADLRLLIGLKETPKGLRQTTRGS